MELRAYTPADRDACLTLFDAYAATHFAAHERDLFSRFLTQPEGAYFVAEHDGQLAACGGYALLSPHQARLHWILVRRDLARNGIGRFLVFSLLHKLTREHSPRTVSLDTTPLAAGFFERQGFHPVTRIVDGFAPGLDRVTMEKKLQVCP